MVNCLSYFIQCYLPRFLKLINQNLHLKRAEKKFDRYLIFFTVMQLIQAFFPQNMVWDFHYWFFIKFLIEFQKKILLKWFAVFPQNPNIFLFQLKTVQPTSFSSICLRKNRQKSTITFSRKKVFLFSFFFFFELLV